MTRSIAEISTHDRVLRAIGILQALEAAAHSNFDPKAAWGANYVHGAVIEQVIELLLPVLDEVE